MICVGFSDILYSGDKLGENSHIVWTDLALLYAPVVTQSMIFTLMIFIDTSDSCHFRGSSTGFDENLNSDPIVRFVR